MKNKLPFLIAAGMLFSFSLFADNQTVTNNNDSGPGSLRQAIEDVGDGETITFDADYTITVATALQIDKSLTITGNGAAETIIQAYEEPHMSFESGGDHRVFEILSGTVVLENLAVINGSEAEDDYNGGGIYADVTSLTLNNCLIDHNFAGWGQYGGGIYMDNGDLNVNNSTISYNEAWYEGGGIYFNSPGSTLTINNSTIDNNSTRLSSSWGGGIYSNWGDLVIENNSVISNNITHRDGGGVYYYAGENFTVTNSSFTDNEAYDGNGAAISISYSGTTADISSSVFDANYSYDAAGNGGYGGAIYNDVESTMTIDKCTFNNNYAASWGGGIVTYDAGISATISNSTFDNNEAVNWGGGMVIDRGDVSVYNCTFSGNSTTNSDKGGGALGIWSASATLKFLTIANNTAAGRSGGLFFDTDYSGTYTVSNCLFANNTGDGSGDDFYNNGATLTDNGYNIIEFQGGATGATLFTAASNIYGDQSNLFGTGIATQTLADNGGSTQTLAIGAGSVAIGAGTWDASVTKDQRDMYRDNPPTIGAYEHGGYKTKYYVDTDATGNNDGTSWADAFNFLQDALGIAADGDVIWVAAGTYYPDEETDRTETFTIPSGVKVYGGFAGTETATSQRSTYGHGETNETILSGDIDKNSTLDATNSYHVVTLGQVSNTTSLDGFTITMGYAVSTTWSQQRGGAIYHYWVGTGSEESSPQINTCYFTNNYAERGGAVYLHAENGTNSTTFTSCSFNSNTASPSGGAIYTGVDNSGENDFTFNSCTFNNNSAEYGGAIYCDTYANGGGTTIGISGGTITNNSCTENGGFININQDDAGSIASVSMSDISDISGNSAGYGGVIYFYDDNTGTTHQFTIADCDFSNNDAGDGGVFNFELYGSGSTLDATVSGCSFTGNESTG